MILCERMSKPRETRDQKAFVGGSRAISGGKMMKKAIDETCLMDRSLDHALCALYAITDVALITSLRDGMNLVTYEFVACQASQKGVLILSEVVRCRSLKKPKEDEFSLELSKLNNYDDVKEPLVFAADTKSRPKEQPSLFFKSTTSTTARASTNNPPTGFYSILESQAMEDSYVYRSHSVTFLQNSLVSFIQQTEITVVLEGCILGSMERKMSIEVDMIVKPYWRGGPWDGGRFIGIPEHEAGYSNLISLMPANSQEGAYLTVNLLTSSGYRWLYIKPNGVFQMIYWDSEENMWDFSWEAPDNACDVYGVCGNFAICTNKSPICDCLKGFVPMSNEEWSKNNWTRGCVRRSELLCEKNQSSLASGKSKPDKFQVLKGLKLPDRYHYFLDKNPDECQNWCMEDLIDIKQFSFGGENLFLRLSYAEIDPKKRSQLDWATRFNIIQGIGRGLIYLHRDSCLRIIHRDLKCGNILLDEKMNPKISDFGLARNFQMTQELANTHRIVGT
ncbi:G-type lectin S-receptor-like serine/threonine-protein kinase [Tanacetum coccineum]